MKQTPIVEVTQLRASRGSFVLSDVTFTLNKGSTLAIVGPNGAGKSTLIDTIAGAHTYEGLIRSAGDDLRTLKRTERARRIAYVPQRSGLRAGLRVEEVVAMGRFAHVGQGTSREDRAAVDDALARLSLMDLRARSFLSLSLGQQQRALLARALCTEAPLVLLDEPFAPLDIRQRLEAEALLSELTQSRRTTFVIVMHELKRAAQLCSEMLVLNAGKQAAFGAPEEALSDTVLAEVFGVVRTSNGFELCESHEEEVGQSE